MCIYTYTYLREGEIKAQCVLGYCHRITFLTVPRLGKMMVLSQSGKEITNFRQIFKDVDYLWMAVIGTLLCTVILLPLGPKGGRMDYLWWPVLLSYMTLTALHQMPQCLGWKVTSEKHTIINHEHQIELGQRHCFKFTFACFFLTEL